MGAEPYLCTFSASNGLINSSVCNPGGVTCGSFARRLFGTDVGYQKLKAIRNAAEAKGVCHQRGGLASSHQLWPQRGMISDVSYAPLRWRLLCGTAPLLPFAVQLLSLACLTSFLLAALFFISIAYWVYNYLRGSSVLLSLVRVLVH